MFGKRQAPCFLGLKGNMHKGWFLHGDHDVRFLPVVVIFGVFIFGAEAPAQIPISSIGELQKIGNDPSYPLDGHYVLTQDIDASVTASWNGGAGFAPIGANASPFTGVFDGAGHVITNLVINRPSEDFVGLFGAVDAAGRIQNLGMESVYVDGSYFVGAVVGALLGSVTSCYVTGVVTGYIGAGGIVGYGVSGTVVTSHMEGIVTGYYSIGGVIGYTETEVRIASSYATGEVLGEFLVGGLVGVNYGEVTSCYSTCEVTGTSDYLGGLVAWNEGGTIELCYATGSVVGDDYVGGLVGANGDPDTSLTSGGPISLCYAVGDVTGDQFVGGLVGWTEAELLTCVTLRAL